MARVMEGHDFYDSDVVKAVAHSSVTIELILNDGTQAAIISACDVVAMAKHFGLAVFKKSDAL